MSQFGVTIGTVSEPLYTYQPALGVPPAMFETAWRQAERMFVEQQSRHLCGVLAAFRWMVNVEAKGPITGRRIPATSWTMLEEAHCAYAAELKEPPPVAYELPLGMVIASEYAIGVWQALEWAGGIRDDCPVPHATKGPATPSPAADRSPRSVN
jgi:hypothetical protein